MFRRDALHTTESKNVKPHQIHRATAVAVALLLTTAAAVEAGLRWPPPKFSDAQCGSLPENYEELAFAIKRSLKDLDSARMRVADMKPVRDAVNDNSQWVAGIDVGVYVNAKNSYGGYTGEHLFQVSFAKGKVVNCIDVTANRMR